MSSSQKTHLKPLERVELKHEWLSKLEDFLQSIDDTGGWPLNYTHVSFYHDGPGGNRYCRFTTYKEQSDWWTSVCSADDYYYWKLSENKLKEIKNDIRHKIIIKLMKLNLE